MIRKSRLGASFINKKRPAIKRVEKKQVDIFLKNQLKLNFIGKT